MNAYNNGGSGGSVNMRSGAGTSYTIVVQVPHGATVTGTKSGDWSYMTYGSKSGYMMSVFLDAQGSGGTTGTATAGVINGTNVNVRSSPSTGANVLKVVNTGNKVNYYAGESYSGSGYSWYRCTSTAWSGDGYIVTNYVNPDSGGSSGGSLKAGNYVKVKDSTVNVRASANASDTKLGVLYQGTLAYCEQVVSSTWVKVRWGGRTQTYGYIMSQYLEDGGTASSSRKQRAVDIAKSMALPASSTTTKYPYQAAIGNLDLTATDWCVQYISWLMKAAGCSSYPDFTTQAQVSSAASFFGSGFGTRASGKTPSVGDWVMYSGSAGTWAHVGFVVAVSGTSVTTVEGNLGKTVKFAGPYNYTVGVNNFTCYGFATPTWN